ncbi:MAG: hypothetical protein FJ263_03515 [Planctomycetes bacterium]|nr:hypothetical protein [Planctomycetota bacterium]
MPFTPYHFGLSALPGLWSRGRLDIAVLVAANVLIDTEVLADSFFSPGWPVHQLWHFHTLLVGGIAGMTFGAIVYGIKPFRRGCRGVNAVLGFSHAPTLFSMILSGLVGAWLHVLIDGFYHYDVQVFWPLRRNFLFNWAYNGHWSRMNDIQHWIIWGCIVGWVLAGLFTIFFLFRKFHRPKKDRPA